MKTVFLGERTPSMHGSGLTGAFNNMLPTPPQDTQFPDVGSPYDRAGLDGHAVATKGSAFEIDAWMELWDYAGGASFRAFIANDGEEKTLFVFFDIEGVMGRDLKKA